MPKYKIEHFMRVWLPVFVLAGSALITYGQLSSAVADNTEARTKQERSINRIEFNLSNFMSKYGTQYDWKAGGE